MLLPPGIKNEGNICFASSILHCLLNQKDFCRLLDAVKLQHLQQSCIQCKGLLSTIVKHPAKMLLAGGREPLPRGASSTVGASAAELVEE